MWTIKVKVQVDSFGLGQGPVCEYGSGFWVT
jgi:hypothetical protein